MVAAVAGLMRKGCAILACGLLALQGAWPAHAAAVGAAPAAPTAAPDALGRTTRALFQGAATCALPSVVGPFYCPSNETVYIDEGFERAVLLRTGADGDAALALLVGHEVAHHVQNLLGTTALVEQARSRSTAALSTRTWTAEELQADCYAGLWMRTAAAAGQLHLPADPSALLAGLGAVSRQYEAHLGARETMPDPILTYGTAAQRRQWLEHGLQGKGLPDCDTFSAESAGKL